MLEDYYISFTISYPLYIPSTVCTILRKNLYGYNYIIIAYDIPGGFLPCSAIDTVERGLSVRF